MAILERSDVGDGWAHGRVGNVVFLYYKASAPNEALERSFGLVDRTIAMHPKGIALVAIFGERVRVPSAPLLRRVVDHLQKNAEQMLIGCTVLEGDGMSAAVKRGAVNLVLTLAGPPYPHRLVRSPAIACDFVAPRAIDDSGAPLGQGALFVAVTALRPRASLPEQELGSASL